MIQFPRHGLAESDCTTAEAVHLRKRLTAQDGINVIDFQYHSIADFKMSSCRSSEEQTTGSDFPEPKDSDNGDGVKLEEKDRPQTGLGGAPGRK